MTIRRLLAVSHQATFTGAPIVLSSFLEWVSEHTETEIHTVVMSDGPLVSRFEALGPVTVLDRSRLSSVTDLAHRGLMTLGSRWAGPLAAARLRPALRRIGEVDLVYLNSFTSIEVAPHLRTSAPVVSHIHELHHSLRTHPCPRMVEVLRERPDAWVAASDAVASMLDDLVGVPPERVLVQHEFIDVARIEGRRVQPEEVARLRATLGIPTDARVVMGSGTTDWRKGPELFVQLAAEVRRRCDRSVHFVWVGGATDDPYWERVRTVLDRTAVDHVHFVGTTPDPLPWYSAADVFVLTSHEDPFPLVCLEHAALGHPVVAYRNGGIVELLEPAGVDAALGVVDHLDVGGMAAAVLRFLEHPALARKAGAQLSQRVRSHHDLHANAARLNAHFEALVASRR